MTGDLSILRLIVQASPVVQLVIALLLAASLMSWAMIFGKRMMVRRAPIRCISRLLGTSNST